MYKQTIQHIIIAFIMIVGTLSVSAQNEAPKDFDYKSLPIYAPENMVVEEVSYVYPIEIGWLGKLPKGEMTAIGNNQYRVWFDVNHKFTFTPIEKINEYSGEPIPFNPAEFAKSPNSNEWKIVSYEWEKEEPLLDTRVNDYHKLIADSSRLVAIENLDGKTFVIRPRKKYHTEQLYFNFDVNPRDIIRESTSPTPRIFFITAQIRLNGKQKAGHLLLTTL